MSNKDNKNFINDLKTRIVLPFYIDEINPRFFDSLQKYRNHGLSTKILSKIEKNIGLKEVKKILDTESISDHNTILLLINRIIKKIVAKTGTKEHDLFVEKGYEDNKQPYFVEEKYESYDLKVIGDIHSDRRYIYAIDIDRSTYLFKYIEQIQFSFYLDENNKMLSGAVSWNWGNETKGDKYDIFERIYMNSLVRCFFSKELKNISLNNILALFGDVINNNSKGDINVDKLFMKWSQLVQDKFLNDNSFSKEKMSWYTNELFYSILIVLMISLAVYEELKIYFRHSEPEIYIPLLKRIITIKEDLNQDYLEDFNQLAILLKNNYFHWGKIKWKKIMDADEAINALIQFDEDENRSFGIPMWNYEIIRNSDVPFLDEESSLFSSNREVTIFYLLTMNPELFGLNDTNFNFIRYSDLVKNIKEWKLDDEWNKIISNLVDKTICEWNYDYISFYNKSLTSIIIKNNNPILIKNKNKYEYEVDANRKLFNNYLWAQIYTQALVWKTNDIEANFDAYKNKYPHLLRNYCYELDKLHFDWYDNFYGLPEIRRIIAKINDFHDINKMINHLKNKINRADKIYGKGKERRNIAFAFITATLFGITDFLTVVFSILTVSDSIEGIKNPANVGTITFGTALVFILFLILINAIFKPLYIKRKYKKENKRKIR